jgi:hypothetical protein
VLPATAWNAASLNPAICPDEAAVVEGAKKTAKLNWFEFDIATPPAEISVVALFAKLTVPCANDIVVAPMSAVSVRSFFMLFVLLFFVFVQSLAVIASNQVNINIMG